MANNHVEIHDPFSNHKHQGNNSGPGSENADMEDMEDMEDMAEYKIVRAYAQRRRPKKPSKIVPPWIRLVGQMGDVDIKEPSSPETPAKEDTGVKEEKKRKRKGWKRILICIKPQIEDKERGPTSPAYGGGENDRSFNYGVALSDDVIVPQEPDDEETELEQVAGRLTELADEIPFTPPSNDSDLETDSPDDVEKVIGLLLRDAGDKLNEGTLKDIDLAQLFVNYGFFKTLMTTFLKKMGLMAHEPDALGPHASPKTQIAVACEVTSRLLSMEALRERELMRHGARYLQEHFSPWADQQGGYEKAFEGDPEDEVE